MIARSSRATGFTDLARYLDQDKTDPTHSRAAHTWTQHCCGLRDVRATADLMTAVAARNRRVEKPAYHLIVSWDRTERPSPASMERAGTRLITDLGLGEYQAALVEHRDRDHAHIHLVANRVQPVTLEVWSPAFDYRRIQRSLRAIEAEMGFRPVLGHLAPTPDGQYADRSQSWPSGARRMEMRARELGETDPNARDSFLRRVRRDAAADFTNARTWAELRARLKLKGLRLERRPGGLALTDGTLGAAVSRVAEGASLSKLERRFGTPFPLPTDRTPGRVQEIDNR